MIVPKSCTSKARIRPKVDVCKTEGQCELVGPAQTKIMVNANAPPEMIWNIRHTPAVENRSTRVSSATVAIKTTGARALVEKKIWGTFIA